jgi:hypothetical protein
MFYLTARVNRAGSAGIGLKGNVPDQRFPLSVI